MQSMFANSDRPPWAQTNVKCALQESDDAEYTTIGGHGVHTSNTSGIEVLKQARNAVLDARKALAEKSTPNLAWTSAAEQFKNLPALPEEWDHDVAAEPIASGQVNLAHVLRHSEEIGIACEISAMYHDPDVHIKKTEMARMAELAQQVKTNHLICPARICSRLAIMECEDEIAAANHLEQAASAGTATDTPVEVVNKYQRHVALAKLHFETVLPDMRTPELKTGTAALLQRARKSYADTFDAVLKNEEQSFSSVTIK